MGCAPVVRAARAAPAAASAPASLLPAAPPTLPGAKFVGRRRRVGARVAAPCRAARAARRQTGRRRPAGVRVAAPRLSARPRVGRRGLCALRLVLPPVLPTKPHAVLCAVS